MGMRERAGHFGGTLTITSVPNHGTVARLAMPFPVPSPTATEETSEGAT